MAVDSHASPGRGEKRWPTSLADTSGRPAKAGDAGVSHRFDEAFDVVVIGSGAAGLTAAITARKAGLDVLIVEKEPVFGGTTATSGGTMWIPGNRHSVRLAASLGVDDDIEKARRYLEDEGGNFLHPEKLDAYLRHGAEAVDFLERETELELTAVYYPDYRSESPHASIVRSIRPLDYRASKLGRHYRDLKGQLPQTLFLGIAFGSINGATMKNLLRAGTSAKAFLFTAGKILSHLADVARHGHAEHLYNGRALIARLARTVFDLGIPMWLSSPAQGLITEDGRVGGLTVATPQGVRRLGARRGVILACGGYPGDLARRAASYPAPAIRANLRSPTPVGNTGDGIALAESVGGRFDSHVRAQGAWMPVSINPKIAGNAGVWPHLTDRQKPGFIAVLRNGRRFTNESASYPDFVEALIRASEPDEAAECFLIGDLRAIRRYGMGFVRPFPVPRLLHERSGYLLKGRSLDELARKAGIDPAGLARTVADFNADAAQGRDAAFGRGARSYDLCQGDEHAPDPCLAPLVQAPYFAVKLVPGEIGTFAGVETNEHAQVMGPDDQPVGGLYAVGNDARSVFGGVYPGAGGTLGPGVVFGYLAGRHVAGATPAIAGNATQVTTETAAG